MPIGVLPEYLISRDVVIQLPYGAEFLQSQAMVSKFALGSGNVAVFGAPHIMYNAEQLMLQAQVYTRIHYLLTAGKTIEVGKGRDRILSQDSRLLPAEVTFFLSPETEPASYTERVVNETVPLLDVLRVQKVLKAQNDIAIPVDPVEILEELYQYGSIKLRAAKLD